MGTKFYRSVGLRLNPDESNMVEKFKAHGITIIDIFRAGLNHYEKQLKKGKK